MSKRSDDSDIGWLASVPLVVAMIAFTGVWWWARGRPLFGDQARGWLLAASLVVRNAILGAGLWMTVRPGENRWWGIGVLLACSAGGWLAYLVRLNEGKKRARARSALAG